jgi:hypothetical protein
MLTSFGSSTALSRAMEVLRWMYSTATDMLTFEQRMHPEHYKLYFAGKPKQIKIGDVTFAIGKGRQGKLLLAADRELTKLERVILNEKIANHISFQ